MIYLISACHTGMQQHLRHPAQLYVCADDQWLIIIFSLSLSLCLGRWRQQLMKVRKVGRKTERLQPHSHTTKFGRAVLALFCGGAVAVAAAVACTMRALWNILKNAERRGRQDDKKRLRLDATGQNELMDMVLGDGCSSGSDGGSTPVSRTTTKNLGLTYTS